MPPLNVKIPNPLYRYLHRLGLWERERGSLEEDKDSWGKDKARVDAALERIEAALELIDSDLETFASQQTGWWFGFVVHAVCRSPHVTMASFLVLDNSSCAARSFHARSFHGRGQGHGAGLQVGLGQVSVTDCSAR